MKEAKILLSSRNITRSSKQASKQNNADSKMYSENDILHRFWQTGSYEKHPVHGAAAEGGLSDDGGRSFRSSVYPF